MSDDADSEPRAVKSLVVEKLGDPTEALGSSKAPLRLARLPQAALPPGAVRLRVLAASLNFADALMVAGKYQERPKLPFVPGGEVSGVVVECGRDVRTLRIGDKACALTQSGGAFAEEVVVRENSVIKLPQGIGPEKIEEAAGLPVAFGTAYLALRDRANVQPGQTVLVLGAAGGVGLAAVQLARLMGARVVAVAAGAAKMAALRGAGADACVDSEGRRPEELPALLRKAAPQGVDVVFDPVGGAMLAAALKAARWGAAVLVIGFASGTIPSIPANVALVNNLTVHGVYWGSYAQHEPRLFRHSLDEVGRLFAAGDLSVNISHRYSLEQAPEAFSVLMRRQVVGKLLLLPAPRSML